MKNIVIAGGGTLGSQIAFHAAYWGYNVTIWLRSENFIPETTKFIDDIYNRYVSTLNMMAKPDGKSWLTWNGGLVKDADFNLDEMIARANYAGRSIKLEISLKEAVKDADMVIEAITENFDAKFNFFKMVSPLLREDTIVTTSTSSMLPSKLAKAFSNSSNFLGLHFSNPISQNNIAEIMIHSQTSNIVLAKVTEFAKSINLIAIPILKENKGYIFNACLIPFLFSALDIYCKGVSSFENIDTAWKVGMYAPYGPFEVIDKVGLKTVLDVVEGFKKVPTFIAPYDFKAIYRMLKKYVDQGKLGKISGEGFYKYKD